MKDKIYTCIVNSGSSFSIGTTNIPFTTYSCDLKISSSSQFILIQGIIVFQSLKSNIASPYAAINYKVTNQNITEPVYLGYFGYCYITNTKFGNGMHGTLYKNYIQFAAYNTLTSGYSWEFMYDSILIKYA